MPAASDSPALALPRTFRPRGVRIAAYLFGGLLVTVSAVIWFSLPQNVRDQFTIFQRGTVIFFGLAACAAGQALARSRIEARESGVTVVNGFKSRGYDWNEIVALTLGSGSPWAMIDLSDGTSVAAMGIQGSDGARAMTQVRQLRALIVKQSRTNPDDDDGDRED